MKILAIDDQPLITFSVHRKLTNLDYTVETANNGISGIKLFDEFKPDLVIVDYNMPGMTGIEVIEHIRNEKNSDIPIIVMSGNTDEQVVIDTFNLGITDYLKKPIGLEELVVRIKRIFGEAPSCSLVDQEPNQMIQNYCIGVVIPCYNEGDRLSQDIFKQFANKNLGYHLCFVNDGSSDNTLEVLEDLRKGNESHVSIVDCEVNRGKAEAVRQGVLHLIKDHQLDYIGYLDADLSTDFQDFDDLVQVIDQSEFKIVSGSRMSRMGANITKQSARSVISKTINLIIRSILKMPFNDTQCGAKIMDRDIASSMFNKPFVTRWLFDVEIFMRMRKYYGKERVLGFICEQPLKRWIHADGSKLSMKDSFKIVGQLAQIAVHYK